MEIHNICLLYKTYNKILTTKRLIKTKHLVTCKIVNSDNMTTNNISKKTHFCR